MWCGVVWCGVVWCGLVWCCLCVSFGWSIGWLAGWFSDLWLICRLFSCLDFLGPYVIFFVGSLFG